MKFWFWLFIVLPFIPAYTQTPHLIIPKGHTQSITSIAVSHDGKFIVSGSKDKTAILWNMHGEEVQIMHHQSEVKSLALSPDGKFIVTACTDGYLYMWNMSGEHLWTEHTHEKQINSICFSNDGKYIISGSNDHSIRISDLQGKLIRTFTRDAAITSVAISPDGKHLLFGSSNKTTELCDLEGNKLHTFFEHKGSVLQNSFSADGRFILSAAEDSFAILWNLNGNLIQYFKHQTKIISSVFSSDNQLMATAGIDGLIKIWKVPENNTTTQRLELHSFKVNVNEITTIQFSADGNSIFAGFADKSLMQYNFKGQLIEKFQGHSQDVTAACFSPDRKYIATACKDHSARLWDIFDNAYIRINGNHSNVICVAFSQDSKILITGSQDNIIKFWNLGGHELKSIPVGDKLNTIEVLPDSNHLIALCQSSLQILDLNGKLLNTIPIKSKILSLKYSSDGKNIRAIDSSGTILNYDVTGKNLNSIPLKTKDSHSLSVFLQNKSVVTADSKTHLKEWNSETGQLIKELEQTDQAISSLASSHDDQWIASGEEDGKISLLNHLTNNTKLLISHSSKINSLYFSNDGNYLLSASEDETVKIWNCKTGSELATLISLDSMDWVVTNHNGFFDATPAAMEHLDYTVGLEEVELEQIKERYYEPGLLEEVFGLTEMDFGNVSSLSNVGLYPELEAVINGSELKIHLTSRSGGIGKLSIFVDHKEMNEDANPDRKTDLKIDLNNYSRFFYGDTNIISLIVYNEEGWLESRPLNLLYFPYEGSKGKANASSAKAPIEYKGQPHLYALVVGTSDYSGDQLDLKFPDLDAAAIAHGMQAVGSRLFEERVHIKLLSTSTKSPDSVSSKANIEKTLKEFATKATAGDVVVCYFSGHGTTYGQAEKNQFYYLTKDIANENLSDPEIRKNYTVSSDDLTKWLTAIPAHKEVLIFDACHSGKAIEALSTLGARELSPSQIRALDRMKDRSGIFILSGSAADAVSYEASTYGQGLLTYSLLQGMSGMAVTEDKRVDLAQLFEYARDKVPEFAKSINKIQTPVVAFPKGGGSFDIGIVDATVKIPLAQPKPVFIRNIFLEETTISDTIELTHAMSDYLRSITSQGAAAELIYVDVNDYVNAYSIKGLYKLKGSDIHLRVKLYQGKNSVGEFKLDGNSKDIQGLISQILEKISGMIKT